MENRPITAQLLSPLVIKKERQSQFSDCLDYIPGSTLRGALAHNYLELFGKDVQFEEIFLDERCRFTNLVPGTSCSQQSRFLPLSAMSCKREPGFFAHGVIDILWSRALLRMQTNGQPSHKVPTTTNFTCPWPGCDHDLKGFHGYWSDAETQHSRIEVSRTETLHTGIDRGTGTVARSILFSLGAVEPWLAGEDGRPIYFTGNLRTPAALWPRMEEMLARSPTMFLGRGRSRGQGEIKLTIAPVLENEKDTWEVWSATCAAVLSPTGMVGDGGSFFSLGLASDAILMDRFLRYTAEPDLQIDGAELLVCMRKQGVAMGWNTAHGLPKEDEITLSRGSVFLYRYPGPLDEIRTQLINLQGNGIGLRRNEGFGQVMINDPFHMTYNAFRRNER